MAVETLYSGISAGTELTFVKGRARCCAGQVVAMAYGHRSHCVAAPARERTILLPPGIDPLLGIYVAHMGPTCANGLLTPPRTPLAATQSSGTASREGTYWSP